MIDQLEPNAVIIKGRSKAENVSGEEDEHYALGMEIVYKDGTIESQQLRTSFETGID